jgi:uncharacterized iron-regulated protein
MKASNSHRTFAWLLQEDHNNKLLRDVLNHPEKYLGPNWDEVINFWLYLDTLTEDQLRVIRKRHGSLSYEELDVDKNKVSIVAGSTTKYADSASSAAYNSVSYANNTAFWATYELIGVQKLLEQGYKPVFFPMFLNP